MKRTVVFLGIVAVAAAAIYLVYKRDLNGIAARVAAGSETVETRHGAVQYAISGDGPAVLAIHGAGGGYDQGNVLVEGFGLPGYRYVSVSRFGYLGSPLPADASTAAQADAFADLLDTLGIDRVALLAMSGGVPPALQFASRHPDRTSALVLLSSAPFTPLPTQAQDLPVPIWVYNMLFATDFPFWVLQNTARGWLQPIFDVTPELREAMTASEATFLERMIDTFQPVSARQDGLRNEGAALDPQGIIPLNQITAPTLVIHARDDGINPVAIARYIATEVPGSVLTEYARGGHLLITHHDEVRATVANFLQANAAGPAR